MRFAFCAFVLLGAAVPLTAAETLLQRADADRAARYSEARRGVAFLVLQNGRTLSEHYAGGASAETKWPIFSGTKSFWGIAALAAVEGGLFKLDDPVADTITEWKSDGRKARITIRQLLSQTDGIEGASRLHRESVRDRNAAAIRLPLVAEPGTAFTYGPSHLQVLAEVLRRKTGGRSPWNFLRKRVLGPLRLGDLEHKEDARGNPLLATGFKLTAREWARLGELILAEGRGVVSAKLLEEAFRGSDANPAYGLTFWLNAQAAKPEAREIDIEDMLERDWSREEWSHACICREAPPDMVVALGSGYQRLFIIPSLHALIVRQGSNAKFSDAHFLRLVLGREQ